MWRNCINGSQAIDGFSRETSRIQCRAGVNSAPELEFIVNSNSNSGIGIAIIGIGLELELPSLEYELNWN